VGACEWVGVVYHDDLCRGDFSACCFAALSSPARRTRRKESSLAKRNRKLPSKQLRPQSKLPQNPQPRSEPSLNRGARDLHRQSPLLSKCEWRERWPPSG